MHGAIHTTKTFYALSKKVFEDALCGGPGKGTKAAQPTISIRKEVLFLLSANP